MSTPNPLDQFSQVVRNDNALQRQLIDAASDPEQFSELVVKLGNEKGLSLTKDEVLATIGLSGWYYVEHLKNNPVNPLFSSCGSCNTSNTQI